MRRTPLSQVHHANEDTVSIRECTRSEAGKQRLPSLRAVADAEAAAAAAVAAAAAAEAAAKEAAAAAAAAETTVAKEAAEEEAVAAASVAAAAAAAKEADARAGACRALKQEMERRRRGSEPSGGGTTAAAAAVAAAEVEEVEEDGAEPGPWAVLAPSCDGKLVKDVLKAQGWLDQSLRPVASDGGRLAFPCVPASLDAVRAAVEGSRTGGPSVLSSAAPLELCQLPADALPKKRAPKPAQGKPKQGASGKGGAHANGGEPAAPHSPARARSAAEQPPSAKSAKSARSAEQPRSFGGGAGSASLLPPASAIPRLACPNEAIEADRAAAARGAAEEACRGGGEEGAVGAVAAWLRKSVFAGGKPVVVTGLPLGACHGGWTAARLSRAECLAKTVSRASSTHLQHSPTHLRAPTSAMSERASHDTSLSMTTTLLLRQVSVHVTESAVVDLAGHRAPNTPRNFVFRSMPFSEAVLRCSGVGGGVGGGNGSGMGGGGDARAVPREAAAEAAVDAEEKAAEEKAAAEEAAAAAAEAAAQLEPLLGVGERYYLRSVGLDPRKQAADFPATFPGLSRECALVPTPAAPAAPALLDRAAYHSSVLRLASHDTQLWTHFDVMDNALAQLTGRKRVVMWPPSADEDLYVDGSSSRVANIDAWNDAQFPRFRRSVGARSEAELGPGDVLFIPALWFHNVTSIGFSVAVDGGHFHTVARRAPRHLPYMAGQRLLPPRPRRHPLLTPLRPQGPVRHAAFDCEVARRS